MIEGKLTARPPMLIGAATYVNWKVRMRAFVKSIDDGAWMAIEDG